MTSYHAATPYIGSKGHDADHRKKFEFWKQKEKSSSADALSSSSQGSTLASTPIPTRPINIPIAAPSSSSNQEVNPINIQPRTNVNNTPPTMNASPSNSHINNFNFTSLPRGRTNSEAIPPSPSIINLQNRMRTSHDGDFSSSSVQTNASLPNGIDLYNNRKLNTSGSSNTPQTKQPLSSSGSNNLHSTSFTPSNQTNSSKSSPSTSIRSASLHSVKESSADDLAYRRRSLNNERFMSELTLQERPTKIIKSDDEIKLLLQKIENSEHLLNTLEAQLKKETLKRIDNKYRRELEATLNKGEVGRTKTGGEAEQQILQELENYKKLEATYREVLDEVSASKEKLAKLNEQLSIGALDALDMNSKRRLSVRNASNPSIVPESDVPKRKTSSFNEAISSLKRDISRTSIKLLRPLAPIKRQSSKINNPKQEIPEAAPTVAETGTESDGEVETRTVHAELFKQLIQQKYACAENVRSPFIKNLRAKWRQRVSKSDSWMSRLQNGELVHQWEGEEEDMDLDEEELLEDSGVMPHVRKHGSKSQGYIGPPEVATNRFSRKDGEIMLPNNYGYKGTYSDSATSSYIADDISDDDGSAISEGRKRIKKSGKLKSMFAKEKPAHLDQTDVGRLAETLKRRPTHQQLVSKRILRGDAVFGVSLENLIDIPDGIRMMADFLADSGNMDLLDVPGNDRDVMNLQNSIDTGNHSLEMMQLLPYAVGTLFMRFFQQLPEKLLSQQLSPKFLWVQETELPALRYTMFRSLIFLLIVPHRNMLAFLFKWLRKMSEDPRKSMYYTPAYLGNLFGNLIVHGVDMGKAANTTQRLIEDYKRVFLDAEPDIRHFMKDGKQLVKWATVDRLIEKIIDPNCYDEQLPPMFFFCHIYIIGAKELLDKFIGIYLKLRIGPPAMWKSETCKRIIAMLKLWIDNHGLALSSNEPFVAVLADFMKSRRDSADPDATEKELDRTLFTYRTQQNFMSTLPSMSGTVRPVSTQIGGTLSASGSGGRAKQLRIPTTILEHAPREPDALALMTSMSAPNSPRDSADDVAPVRTLTQAASVAHFARTPPKPVVITYLNNEATAGTSKLGKSPPRSSKVPTTPLPTSQPQAVPSLRNNRFTRGPIPPFPSGSSPPPRTGSPIRPRAISNASALHNSSPSSSPPTTLPAASPFNSSSPPPPTKYTAAPTLSPSTSARGRSFSKATNLEVVIPEESSKNKPQSDERKTFRYTTTYKGSIPRNSNPYPSDAPFSPTNSSPLNPFTSPSHSGSISPPTSPQLMFPISPTSATSPSSPTLPSSSLAMSYSVNSVTFAADVNFENSANSSGFQIPKSTSVDSHLANVDGQVKRNRAYSVAHGRSASAQLPLPGPSASTDLLEIDPKLIAEHMTIVDHELLKAIPMSELLHKNYMDCKASPNFANMATKLNEWGSWTLKEILKQTDLYTRANVLSLFIEISKENLAYNNFNSCCAILGALNNPAIQRLKNTWEKVNKKTMSKFRKMMELFDFTYNSKNYREALKITKPPAVPYLGLIPKDITSIEEIPTFVENGMCNIDKMRTLYKILCEVQLFQKEQYTFKVFPEFMRRLKTLKDLYTDEEAYQQSLKIEPRELMTA